MSTGDLGGSAIPAGWYHDPLNPHTSVRYWNGTSWTQHSQPIPHSSLTTDPEQTPMVTTEVSGNGESIGLERSRDVPTRHDDHIGPPGWDNLTGPPDPRQVPNPEQTGSEGWYPHPRDWSQERYWNGSSWEDRYRRVSVADPVSAESSQTPSNEQQNSVPRLPGYRALSSLIKQRASLLTQRAAPPNKPADHSRPTLDRQQRNALILLAGISAVLLAMAAIGEGLGLFPDETTAAPTSAAAASTPSPTPTPSEAEPVPTATQETEPALTNEEQTAPPEEQTEAPSLTVSQENALGSAEMYLSTAAFSRSGLIDQLKFEGYSTKDATFAVNDVEVDWNEQAAKSAESYLEISNFSRSGLIEQLKYEGFTSEQSVYGADSVEL